MSRWAATTGEFIGRRDSPRSAKQPLPGYWSIREAQQLLSFRLDEHGALALAVFKIAPDCLSSGGGTLEKPQDVQKLPFLPRQFVCGSPFVVSLWMKGADWPYLACWVDSEVLLKR